MQTKTWNKVVATVAFLGVASSVASFAVLSQQSTITTPPINTTVTTSIPSVISSSSYKNGTYEVVGNYASPGGAEHIDIKLTLENDIVTAAEVTPRATLPASKNFQGLFAANFKQYVVGKNIDEVQLDKVSGASLTPKGFNDALTKIKAQAKA